MSKVLFPTIVQRHGSYLRINDHIFNRTDIVSISKFTGVLRVETCNGKSYDIVVDYGYNMQLTNIIFDCVHSQLGPKTKLKKMVTAVD